MTRRSMRDFDDVDGSRWRVELISHGGTSEYLNPKVHKPILQFSCLNRRRSRSYLGYSPEKQGGLDTLPEAALRELLLQSTVH